MRTALVSLLSATSSRHGRGQIAAALTVGVVCGLLPKTSGLFVALLVLVYFLPVHLLLTLTVTIVVGLLSQPLIGWFDQVGSYSLTHPDWSEFWLRLDSYTLVPWLGLHNSVVHGAALVSAAFCLPGFLISHGIAAWLMPHRKPILIHADRGKTLEAESELPIASRRPSAAELLEETELNRSSELQLPEESQESGEFTPSARSPEELVRGMAASEQGSLDSFSSQTEDSNSVSRLEQVLAEYNSDDFQQVADQDDVLRRAARLVGVVDEILHAIEAEHEGEVVEPQRETGLEQVMSTVEDWMQVESMRADSPHSPLTDPTIEQWDSSAPDRKLGQANGSNRRNRRGPGRAREGEVLRHLLHHLRELKEPNKQEKV